MRSGRGGRERVVAGSACEGRRSTGKTTTTTTTTVGGRAGVGRGLAVAWKAGEGGSKRHTTMAGGVGPSFAGDGPWSGGAGGGLPPACPPRSAARGAGVRMGPERGRGPRDSLTAQPQAVHSEAPADLEECGIVVFLHSADAIDDATTPAKGPFSLPPPPPPPPPPHPSFPPTHPPHRPPHRRHGRLPQIPGPLHLLTRWAHLPVYLVRSAGRQG